MMLGALPPTNVSVIKDRIVTTATNPAKVQTFATQTSQAYDPSKGVSPIVTSQTTSETNIMDTLKKYAPISKFKARKGKPSEGTCSIFGKELKTKQTSAAGRGLRKCR